MIVFVFNKIRHSIYVNNFQDDFALLNYSIQRHNYIEAYDGWNICIGDNKPVNNLLKYREKISLKKK